MQVSLQGSPRALRQPGRCARVEAPLQPAMLRLFPGFRMHFPLRGRRWGLPEPGTCPGAEGTPPWCAPPKGIDLKHGCKRAVPATEGAALAPAELRSIVGSLCTALHMCSSQGIPCSLPCVAAQGGASCSQGRICGLQVVHPALLPGLRRPDSAQLAWAGAMCGLAASPGTACSLRPPAVLSGG